MRLEPEQFWTFSEWFFNQNGLLNGFLLAIVLIVLGFVLSYLVAMVRYGPGEGFYVISKTFAISFCVIFPTLRFDGRTQLASLPSRKPFAERYLRS